LEITGGDTMEIKCPYCGSEEYEVYDTCGGSGENVQELCACFDCDKQFSVIYVVDCIVKES
jgi:transcriptional regulator NrdR family protein